MKHTDSFINLVKNGTLPESTLIKMSEFKDRLDDHKLVKSAFLSKVKENKAGTSLGKMLLLGAAIGAAGPAFGVVEDSISGYMENRKREPAFNKMLEYHPQLKNEDMDLVKKYFESIWHFSPHMAQDPLAAGAYIRSAMFYHDTQGGPAPNMAVDLTALQRNVSAGKSDSKSRFLDLSGVAMPELIA